MSDDKDKAKAKQEIVDVFVRPEEGHIAAADDHLKKAHDELEEAKEDAKEALDQ